MNNRKHNNHVKPVEKRLLASILLNAVIVVAEFAGGIISGSLALLSDAIHNLSDVAALTIAFFARMLGKRPPSQMHTYGLGRIEVMAALFNSAMILVVGTLIIRAAIAKLMHPVPVLRGIMLSIAVVGLIANMVSVLLLKNHIHGDLNIRAAVLHLLQDTISSVAVVVAALFAGWKYGSYLDPVVSILVIVLVLFSGWKLLRNAARVLLEGTPDGLDLKALQEDINGIIPGSILHHIHVWEIRPEERIMTAHLKLCNDTSISSIEDTLRQIRQRLQTKWGIVHSTLEPEIGGCGETGLLGSVVAKKCIVFLLLLLLPFARAEKQGQHDKITLAQAVEIALEKNPDIGEAKSRLLEAESRLMSAKSGNWPSIKIRGTYDYWTEDQRLFPATRNGEQGVFGPETMGVEILAAISLYDGGRISSDIDSASWNYNAATNQLVRIREVLVYQVVSLFYNLLAQDKVLDSLDAAMNAMNEHLKNVQALVEVEKAARVDLLRANVRKAELSERQVREKNNRNMQLCALMTLLGMDEGSVPVIVGELEIKEITACGETSECMEKALKQRADYMAARAALASAEAAVKSAYSGYKPKISIQASYGERMMFAPSDQPEGTEDSINSGRIGVIMELPLFDGKFTSAKIMEQKARQQAALERLRKVELQIRYEVETALAEIASAKERVITARETVSQADESFRIMKEKYDLGKGTMTDVLDVQSALVSAQTSYFRALADLAIADARRKLAIGEILP